MGRQKYDEGISPTLSDPRGVVEPRDRVLGLTYSLLSLHDNLQEVIQVIQTYPDHVLHSDMGFSQPASIQIPLSCSRGRLTT